MNWDAGLLNLRVHSSAGSPARTAMSKRQQKSKTVHGQTVAANRRSDLISDVVEHAPDAIWVFETSAGTGADDWRVVYANAAFEQTYGVSRDDAVGQGLLALLQPRTPEHDLARILSGLKSLAPFRTVQKRDGEDRPLWLEVNYQPRVESDRVLWFAVSRNVTENVITQRRSMQLSRALDEAQEAIAVSNARGKQWSIEYVNRAFTEMLGYEPGDLVGTSWRRLLAREADFKRVEDYRIGLLTGQRVSGELLFRRKDGSVVLLSLSATPFRVNGEDGNIAAVTTFRDITGVRREERRLREQAALDPLTGLKNRREFERLLQAAIDMTAPGGRAHVVMFIDLDGFKRVNDTQGHDAGDRVLIAVSQTLRRTLLPSDDLARWGGDEFTAILYFCTPEQAMARGNDLIDALSSAPECRGVGASIGIVPIDNGSGIGDLMRRADRLVYEAKAAGRNRVLAEP